MPFDGIYPPRPMPAPAPALPPRRAAPRPRIDREALAECRRALHDWWWEFGGDVFAWVVVGGFCFWVGGFAFNLNGIGLSVVCAWRIWRKLGRYGRLKRRLRHIQGGGA
jgi:hypothetical protein